MSPIAPRAAGVSNVPLTRSVGASTAPSASSRAFPLVHLYWIRGALAVVWALGFATTSDSLTTGAGVLVVVYPLIDVVASLVDSRGDHGPEARRSLYVGAGLSALGAFGLVIAASGDIPDVLRVFGAWAVVSGLTQLVVAIRRRAQLGHQWPMLIAGVLSTLVGVVYIGQAAGDNPTLDALVTYAAAGGIFFIVQAGILAWRQRHATAVTGSGHLAAGGV